MTRRPSTSRPVVVGFDGSKASSAALEWAAAQAERTGAPLEIVTAWEWPIAYGTPVPFPQEYDPKFDAQMLADDARRQVRQSHPDLRIDTVLVRGRPGRVLVGASKGAGLLVVGSRGHGEFMGMTLGSVSQGCVTAAHCPVLVFRTR